MAVDPGCLDEVGAWLRAQADQVIETHIAQVFLVGEHAYKLKKAVNLGYLDFSTPKRREAVLRRELEMNQATAPDIYLAVCAVTREADGTLAFDGAGETLEAVLKMRAFDPQAVLANRPEVVDGDFAEALGRLIAGFHAEAPLRPDDGGAETVAFVIASNAAHVRGLPPLRGDLAERLITATDAAFAGVRDLLETRREAGATRRCHGDLHLGNIVLIGGSPVLFDCIEFNDRLSDIDVLYDLAFLVMDLTFRGQRAGAVRLLNGYLDQALRREGEAALAGLAALPLFLSVRAAVRAHVSAQMGQGALARDYLQAALDHLSPPPPRLVAIGGLSGSGKSAVARALAHQIGAAPGAVILRSDEIRKRLWGAGPRDRLPPEAYAPGTSERVYGVMLDEARVLLAAGRAVVLDAVFLRDGERAAARAVAAASGVPFAGAWLEAPAEVLRARVAARTGDASDADERVVGMQLEQDPGDLGGWMRLDATADPARTAAALV